MDRVVVVGGPGSGKTTLARALAEQLGVRPIELDALWWDTAWTPAGAEELGHRVTARLTTSERWVVDGNYLDEVGTRVLWPAADTLVWLDINRAIGFRRAVGRSLRRLARRDTLWNGNREVLSTLSPRSLVRLWRRWPSYSTRIADALRDPRVAHLEVVRLSSRGEAQRFLSTLCDERNE